MWLLLEPLRGFLGLFPSVGAMDCLSWLDGGAIFWLCHLVKIFKCPFVTQVLVSAQLLRAGLEALMICNSVLVEKQICKSGLDPAVLNVTDPCGLEKSLSVSKVKAHPFALM